MTFKFDIDDEYCEVGYSIYTVYIYPFVLYLNNYSYTACPVTSAAAAGPRNSGFGPRCWARIRGTRFKNIYF